MVQVSFFHPRTGNFLMGFSINRPNTVKNWRSLRLETIEYYNLCKRKTGFLKPKIVIRGLKP